LQHCVDSDLGELLMFFRNTTRQTSAVSRRWQGQGKHFTAETGHGSFEKIFRVSPAVFDRVCYALEVAHRDRARTIEAVCNPDWMDATIK
jgi:hypothetical protein